MKHLKLAVGWTASWTLYWIGNAVSGLLNAVDVPIKTEDEIAEEMFTRFERMRLSLVSPLYSAYNWLMLKSGDVQDWGGAGPWHVCEHCGIDDHGETDAEPPLDDVALEEDASKKPSSDPDPLGPAQMFTWLE